MKKLTLVAALSFAAAALAGEPAADGGFVLAGDAAQGQKGYKVSCAPCHGDKGLGNGPAAAALNPRPASFTLPEVAARSTAEWVYLLARDGGAAHGKSELMAPLGKTLTDQQLRNIAAYVLTLLPPAPAQPGTGARPK